MTVQLDGQRRVERISMQVQACAFGQASAALLERHSEAERMMRCRRPCRLKPMACRRDDASPSGRHCGPCSGAGTQRRHGAICCRSELCSPRWTLVVDAQPVVAGTRSCATPR